VIAPVTSLSDKVDVFDQSDLDMITISVKWTISLVLKNNYTRIHHELVKQ
jgi:hypothetical protein